MNMNVSANGFHGELPQSELLFKTISKPREEKICCKIFIVFLFLSKDVYYEKVI